MTCKQKGETMWKKMPKGRGERMRGNGKRDKYFIFLSHTVAYICKVQMQKRDHLWGKGGPTPLNGGRQKFKLE